MRRRYITKKTLFIGMLICIIIGKIVRHTVMLSSLVLQGIGWSLVDIVNAGTANFGITFSGTEINEAASNATQNACYLFSKLNFLGFANSYYQYEVLVTIVFNIVLFLLFYKLKKKYYLNEAIFIFASVAVLNIFDFCLSKEPAQMLYFLLMFYLLKSNMKNKTKFIASFIIYLLCAFTYRNYYMIMAMFLLYFYFTSKIGLEKTKKIKNCHILLLVLGVFIFHMIIMLAVQAIMPTNYEELIRVRFRGESGASTILILFKSTQPILFSIDYLLVIFRMLIPIELILNGPKYFVFAIYQMIISLIVIKNLKNYNQITESRRIAIVIYMAFLMGSATFEPDFGSWVRHEAVLFPVYLIMCGFDKIGVKK